MHRMKLVFHQVQRKGQLLVIELRLDGDMVVRGQPREQIANLRTAIYCQARPGIPQVELRVVLHVLDKIQLVLRQ